MTDNLWTKGPWEVGQSSTYETALVASASGLVVAYAAWDGGSGCHLEIKNVADAHLIASAPSLYEALAAIVSDIMLGDDVGAFLIAKHAGQAALASARGEPA